MTTFLFWNLANQPLENLTADMAVENDVDVLMFAECSIRPEVLLYTLNSRAVEYSYAPGYEGNEKIKIFSRFSRDFIRPVYEEARFTVRNLSLPGSTNILLAVTHAISKLHYDERDQTSAAQGLASELRRVEKDAGHSRTVLVGDLNMNPFEDGMVIASGLHSVMSRQQAKKQQREVRSKSYPYFYNPMWNLFGDFAAKPPGTYYFSDSGEKVFFWNMFDQVLMRPDLIDRFDKDSLKIIDKVGNISLLSEQGIPNKQISDHLPLLFKFDL